ncbi:MAG: Gfo/Idh/MocA family oxidoreductase [Phycisphaerales bacterium]|nr:Gfo/Idh/MocA family oxidoreductase [Phycisphaerales bacterium]
MSFIEHIPGTRPVVTPARHPRAIGVGVLGLHEGRTMLAALATRCAHLYPAAGCDLSEDKIAASRREWPELFYTSDYDAMLARPEVGVVAIYTPDAQHADHVLRAFRAGKDVICTKPLVNSLDAAREVLRAGRAAGRRLIVAQSTRFFEPFRRQRDAFERGEIGAIELADAHYIHRMDWYYRKSPWAAAETDWIFLGLSHPLDLLRWHLGPIKRVSAMGSRSRMGGSFGVRGFDVYLVNVESASGALGRAMGHYGCHELPRARNCIELMLYGSEGTSLAQYHDMRYVHTTRPEPQPRRDGGFDPGALGEVVEDFLYAGRHFYFNSEVHGMHFGEFANCADAFGRALIHGQPCAPDLEEGVETFCLMEAARQSAMTHQPVELEPLHDSVGLRREG